MCEIACHRGCRNYGLLQAFREARSSFFQTVEVLAGAPQVRLQDLCEFCPTALSNYHRIEMFTCATTRQIRSLTGCNAGIGQPANQDVCAVKMNKTQWT